jgi:drug/metabolite transporter superfamily protein YnfA
MESIRQTEKKYCSRAMTFAIAGALLFILAGYKPVGKGLVLGAVFSVINFIVMGETLPMRMGKSKPRTFLASLGSIFLRYGLIAVPLIVGIKMEQFDVIGVVVGIFSVQLMIFSEHFFNMLSARKKQF